MQMIESVIELDEQCKAFATLFKAYRECSGEVREIVDEMLPIVVDGTDDEQERAIEVLIEALFPTDIQERGVCGLSPRAVVEDRDPEVGTEGSGLHDEQWDESGIGFFRAFACAFLLCLPLWLLIALYVWSRWQ